ncbi:hypothetical protein KVR01_010683 [Diaporthe batatas]|uniref:uncharacterized protein n=1 Tax=Diaporthe batatas TaxID=748121 RepID=UPI001D05C129|nr:uncharacterized protein KVR01_010683 [Diaporthe batatas]KAG8160046.1 hypothetical protein KVR01_010683 [Diaporthe batatas]
MPPSYNPCLRLRRRVPGLGLGLTNTDCVFHPAAPAAHSRHLRHLHNHHHRHHRPRPQRQLSPAAVLSFTTTFPLRPRSPLRSAPSTFCIAQSPFATMASATSFYDFKPLDKRGEPKPLEEYKGKVVLVVNTASKCGFTPQFEGLEKLYKGLKEKHPDDFVILGFPCNQFGGQDPGSNDEIQSFCQVNYGVSFPVLGKIDVNGDKADPLYDWLKNEQPGLMGLKRIKWNFEKFLIGRDGKVKGRWASTTKPESLEKPILEQLNSKA